MSHHGRGYFGGGLQLRAFILLHRRWERMKRMRKRGRAMNARDIGNAILGGWSREEENLRRGSGGIVDFAFGRKGVLCRGGVPGDKGFIHGSR